MPEEIANSSSIAPSLPSSSAVGRTVARNAIFMTGGTMALKAINFLYNVYVARALGTHSFGEFATVSAFVGLLQIIAELGVSQYVMREIARDRSKTEYYFWNLVALRFGLACVGIIVITAAAAAFGYTREIVLGVFIMTCTFLLAALETPLQTVLGAHERLDYIAVIGIIGQIAYVLLGSLVLLNDWGFVALLIVGLIAMLPAILIELWLVRRLKLLKGGWQLSPRAWPQMIRAGLPFGLISFTLTIALSIDTVILSKFQPPEAVGWYNVVYSLTRSLLFFFTGFSLAMVPSLSRVYTDDAATVERWYYRSLKIIIITSLPVAVGGMLVAFPLVRLLYTPEYLPAALILQIIIWDVPLIMFANFCGNMTTIIRAEHAAARINSLSAIGNVLLNLYAIPQFGVLGAAWVTVATDLIAALSFHILLRQRLHLPHLGSLFARVVCASALMGLGVYWGLQYDLHLIFLIGIGIGIYGVMVFALRLLDEEEWALLRRAVRR